MEIEIGNRKAEVEWLGKNGNDVQVSIDGRTIGANVVLTDNGICSILYQGRSYNMEAVSFEGGRRYTVKRGYDSYDVRIIDAQARYQQARNGGELRQDDNLSAPMPGKVVRVMVQAGCGRRYAPRFRGDENAEQPESDRGLYRPRDTRGRGRNGRRRGAVGQTGCFAKRIG